MRTVATVRAHLGTWLALGMTLVAIGFAIAVICLPYATASPSTPGLPTPPPPLPTQVTNGDGTRMNCTPNYQYCWPAH